MRFRTLALSLTLLLAAPLAVRAQSGGPPLYRVFLADGTGLASFGEWARVDDRLIFSMPLTAGAGPGDLHLVSLPISRIDMARTQKYAESVRAATYATSRGDTDFAILSNEVARTLNQIATLDDPAARLATAERARRALAEWPANHYGHRATEVREFLGVLDEVIAGLRAAAGGSRFDLALSVATDAPIYEPLAPPPDQAEVIRGLMSAATAVDSPTEKVSLLQSVVALIDRAVNLLPEAFVKAMRSSATASISEEQGIDRQYARLRSTTLTEASQHASRANVRALERLRRRVHEQDSRLGQRRPEDVAALLATLDTDLDAARRLRLAQDQWTIRVERMRQYQAATGAFVATLSQSASNGLDDIRAMAGPAPQLLRPLAQRLDRAARQLAIVEPPAELAAVHALFRSAYSLATNAVQLRLDAVATADVELARQAAAAASGAMMLLDRARSDLAAALKPPIAQ
jgi:hypothetical protein